MNDFYDQYQRIDAAQCDEVAGRLEAGAAARAVADAFGLDPVGLVAAVARVGLGDEGADGPSLVRKPTTRPRLVAVLEREATLSDLFPRAGRPARLALMAGLLQTFDAWEASHHAAQLADDLGEQVTAAAWHMVAHRREPDPGNARYWARRVDPTRAFPTLAALAAPLLGSPAAGRDWSAQLSDRVGGWNPLGMIDLAGQVRPGSEATPLLRRIQRVELLALLGRSVAELG